MSVRARLLLFLIAAAALAISACGGGGGGGVADDDPATLAPAAAPLYFQATLRPSGSLKSDVESLASTVSGLSDPTGQLISYIDRSANDQPTLSGKRISFAKDIEPWLGKRAGVFVDGFTDDPPAAGIVQTTDPDATQKFIDDAKQRGDSDRSYQGIDYLLDGDGGTAVGVVGDFLVLGNEKAFKQAVDVSKGDDSLGDQGEFTDALDEAPSGSLADGYLNVEAIKKQLVAKDPSSAKSFEASIGDASGKTATFSLVPSADSLELDGQTNIDQGFAGADLGDLIGTFPADSFAALAIPDIGSVIDHAIANVEQAGIPGITRAAIDQQLSGADLSLDDITGALGDFGVFVGGSDRLSLEGAGVIESKDQSLSAKLISKLTAITGLAQASGQAGIGPAPVGKGISVRDPEQIGPQPLIVTTEGDKIVIGYGEDATKAALAGGGGTLSGDPTFKQAQSAMGGDGVSGYVSMPGVFRLADSLGALRDPDYQRARPYLDRLSYLIFGNGNGNDVSSSKVIVGVRR